MEYVVFLVSSICSFTCYSKVEFDPGPVPYFRGD